MANEFSIIRTTRQFISGFITQCPKCYKEHGGRLSENESGFEFCDTCVHIEKERQVLDACDDG